jgi:hypothetical protein
LFDSDGLAGEHLAEIDLLPIEADAAAGCDSGSPVMEWIIDVRKAPIGSWRRPVSLCGALHIECLVGALMVVALDEVIELGLAAVLLRVAGFDAFDRNPEPEPPNREFAFLLSAPPSCARVR